MDRQLSPPAVPAAGPQLEFVRADRLIEAAEDGAAASVVFGSLRDRFLKGVLVGVVRAATNGGDCQLISSVAPSTGRQRRSSNPFIEAGKMLTTIRSSSGSAASSSSSLRGDENVASPMRSRLRPANQVLLAPEDTEPVVSSDTLIVIAESFADAHSVGLRLSCAYRERSRSGYLCLAC